MSEQRKIAEGRIGWGLFLFLLGLIAIWMGPPVVFPHAHPLVSFVVALSAFLLPSIGTACWFYGFGLYARTKGYSPIIAILGILGIFGLLILVALPEQRKRGIEIEQPPVQ